jgi:hypothetical protein
MTAAICNALKSSSLAAAIVIAGAGGAAAQERVTWTEQANVEVRGSTLEKTRGCDGCADAGASSTQVIASNGGYVEFTVPEDWTYLVAGLAFRTRGTRFEDIEFGIRFNGNGWADIVESGRYIGGDIDYRAGDRFRIEVMNDRVRYLRNGDVMATSRRRPAYPLAFDVGLGSVGASVANARMGVGRADDLANLNDRDGFRRDDVIDDRDVAGTSGESIAVSARDRWTDTGLTVRAGDSITFDADGAIQMSGERGDTANPSGSGRSAPEALVRNSSAGTLIARIGNSPPFAVGARRTISRAPASGRLYLGVNDDYLDDNDGEYRVSVTIDPR